MVINLPTYFYIDFLPLNFLNTTYLNLEYYPEMELYITEDFNFTNYYLKTVKTNVDTAIIFRTCDNVSYRIICQFYFLH